MPDAPKDAQEAQAKECAGTGALSGERGNAAGCGGGDAVLTLEERHILGRIRAIQHEAQPIKEAIRKLESSDPRHPELTQLRQSLEALRSERAGLEERRIQAARERIGSAPDGTGAGAVCAQSNAVPRALCDRKDRFRLAAAAASVGKFKGCRDVAGSPANPRPCLLSGRPPETL
jgi:hypothetical protein